MVKEPEFQNVRVRCSVTKRVMIKPYEPYEVVMSMEGDVSSTSMTGVKEKLEKMFEELSNTVHDAVESYTGNEDD